MIDATVFSALTPRAIEQVFAFALDLGLKSLVLCAAALVLDRLLGRRVLARSSVLHACLLELLLLPASEMVFPTWRVNLRSEAPALAEQIDVNGTPGRIQAIVPIGGQHDPPLTIRDYRHAEPSRRRADRLRPSRGSARTT